MKAHRTIRYRLYPATHKKHQKLHGTAGACRHVWNYFVEKLKDEYEYYGESKFSYYTLCPRFTTLRKYCRTWLQGYSANIAKMSLKPIETAYKGFFKGNNGLPKFHGKHTHHPSFPIDKGTAKISGEHLYIQKIGWMKFAGSDRYKGEKFVSAQVKYECGNRYAYVVYEIEVSEKTPLRTAVGLDRNCGQVALSDGTIYYGPDLEKKVAKRKRYQRQYARVEQGSNRRSVVKCKLQKAHQAERNTRANWCHQTSKLIADQYDVVYMEGLKTQSMTKSAKGTIATLGTKVAQKAGLNRAILASGWGKLEHYLSYKAKVEKVPAHYTSQTCNKCGATDKKSRGLQSIFKCRHCGHEDNADINAALSILAAGNITTGCGDGSISWSVRRQKIAKKARNLSVPVYIIPLK